MRIFIIALLLLSCSSEPQSELIGSYHLIEWKGVRPDGSVAYPYGEQAEGSLHYDEKGRMSMHLQKAERPLIGTDDYASLDSTTLLLAYQGFFSYYGSYEELGEGRLSQTIEGCKNPDWVGRVLKRKFAVDGDKLTIFSDSVIGMDHQLTWKRIQ